MALQSAAEKLASGKRINKAADDAAGLAISSKLNAEIRSLNQARRNASDGISLVQTAEGGLVETSSMLTRLRELAIQAASDTVGAQERSFLNKEFLALKDEIDRLASTSEFNGTRLLVGNADLADDIANPKGTFPLEIQVGKDYFHESDSQQNPNPINVIRVDLEKLNAFTSGEGSLNIGKGADGAQVIDKQSAQNSIASLDSALTQVNDYRSYLGAIQNRLQAAVSNLGVGIENFTAAKSRIEDTDFAEQTAEFSSQNILQQAGSSVLAQANTMPQIALNLINALG